MPFYLANNFVELQITMGQFITAVIMIVTIAVSVGGLMLRIWSSLSEVRGTIVLHAEKIKLLDHYKTEDRLVLKEIQDTLNKINLKVELLVAHSGYTQKNTHHDYQ